MGEGHIEGNATTVVEGIDVPRVSAWFADNIPGTTPPFTFELIAGGRSNLTYTVDDAAGTRFVLRRPPTGHVLPSAHDMSREHRIISALAPTPVPVAPALGFCADPDVNGAPFYVMGFVEGHILRSPQLAAEALDPNGRITASESLVDVLARIHAIDVDAVGLGELGRREAYVERQLKRWYGQFQEMNKLTGRPVPLVHEVHHFLAAHVPEQIGAAIVHGDYRLDNAILGDDGTVRAVLDWELCTLGDPLADVGMLMVYWAEPGDDLQALVVAPTSTPGFLTRDDMRARYARQSGRDVSQLDFYIAFAYWKLACILEGVFARYSGGAMAGDRSGVEVYERQVELLAQAAHDTMGRL